MFLKGSIRFETYRNISQLNETLSYDHQRNHSAGFCFIPTERMPLFSTGRAAAVIGNIGYLDTRLEELPLVDAD